VDAAWGPGRALGALKQAHQITPQHPEYHPPVHETVCLLAEADRRTNRFIGWYRPLARFDTLNP